MLRAYYVANDWVEEVLPDIIISGYKAHPIGTDGICVQYTKAKDLCIILNVIQKHDKRYKDLGDITLEQVELFKDTPFAHLDMQKFKKYFNL